MNENKEVSKNMKKFGKVLKKIETINVGKKMEYGKDYMKIRFKSNDDLSLNKPIKLRLLTIIIRAIFSKDSKFYPHLFLDNTLYYLV